MCPFFLPTSDLSKRDPLQEFQQITGACCLLLPFFFDQQIFRRGLLQRNNFPLHFSGRTKTPSNKRLLLTACGRSWQHCWTLGSSTGLQITPPAAAVASDLTRHHSDISSNQSCRREDKMFHNNRGVFFLWMEDCVKRSAGLTVMNRKGGETKTQFNPKTSKKCFLLGYFH